MTISFSAYFFQTDYCFSVTIRGSVFDVCVHLKNTREHQIVLKIRRREWWEYELKSDRKLPRAFVACVPRGKLPCPVFFFFSGGQTPLNAVNFRRPSPNRDGQIVRWADRVAPFARVSEDSRRRYTRYDNNYKTRRRAWRSGHLALYRDDHLRD